MIRRFLLILSTVLIVISCTQKKNTTGYEDENSKVIEIKNTELLEFYSYEDSIKYNSANDKIMIGNFGKVQSRALFKSTEFPTDSISIESTPILKIYTNFKEGYEKDKNLCENLKFKIGLITQEWIESYVTWEKTDNDTSMWSLAGGSFELEDSWEFEVTTDDSLLIPIPESFIEKWCSNSDENFGLILFSDNIDKFIEVKSSEYTNYSPTISFSYKINGSDDILEYSGITFYDTFISNTNYNFEKKEELILTDLSPTRMVIKFDLSDSTFLRIAQETDLEIEEIFYDSSQVRKANINKAELKLYINMEESIHPRTESSCWSYILLKDNPSLPLQNEDDDIVYRYFSDNSESISQTDLEYITINVTSFVQAIVSEYIDSDGNEYKNNYGFLIKSLNENKDFQFLKFYDDTAGIGKKPELNITFTIPIFMD